jgi:damage-control phosphatase, subfamily I
MRTVPECMACFLRQAVNVSRTAGADRDQMDLILRDAMLHLEESDWNLPPPQLAVEIYRNARRTTGCDDPYLADKQRANELALGLLDELRQRVEGAEDPFAAAVRLSMAGNVIDVVAFENIDRELVLSGVDAALTAPPVVDHVDALREALLGGDGPVLLLNDNAGEIAFDRVLVEQMLALGVDADRITAMVRGGPAINDALFADAAVVGLDQLVHVTDTGVDAPGLLLDIAGPVAVETYHTAETVISKGQGNFESLPTDDPRVFFLLRLKCDPVCEHLGLPQGSQLVMRGGS